jgi:hypothetical protein
MLLTSYPPAWRELADLTTATHRKYADAHGYDYFADCSETMMPARSPYTDAPKNGYVPTRYFIKFALLDYYLDAEACGVHYDEVAWVDDDLLFTRFDLPLSTWWGDVVTAFDVNGVHPTVIVVRNSVRTRGFMWACNNAGRTLYGTHDWSDNLVLRFFSASPPYNDVMRYVSAQQLCAMTPGLYPIPADVRAEYEWDENSLALHLSALPLETRIAMAKEWIDRLGLL